MKIIKIISFSLAFVLVCYSCSKTKLVGKYDGIAGTWRWFGGWSDNGNPNFKLDLKERGKYKLYNGNRKIDYGRTLEKNGKLVLVSDMLFKQGYFESAGGADHQITLISRDTLGIGNDHIADFSSSGYVRQ